MKNQYRGGRLPKKGGGGIGLFAGLKGAWQERGQCFWVEGWDPSGHYNLECKTMNILCVDFIVLLSYNIYLQGKLC